MEEIRKINFQELNQNELKKLLDRALQFGSREDLEALFDQGMDINQGDFSDRTALMMAASTGKKEVVLMLLERSADVNKVCMYQGRIPLTALDAAREKNKTEIVNILLEHGAKTGKELTP